MKIRTRICLNLLWLASTACAVVSPYSLHEDLDYWLAGTGVSMRAYAEWLDYARSKDTTAFERLDRNTIPAYDRWAIGYYSHSLDLTSTVLTGVEFSIPVIINLWDVHTKKEAKYGIITDLIIYTEVYSFSSSLAIYGKALKVHARPLAFTSNAPDSERRKGDANSAFFSSHTTSAFASAVFTGYTFQLKHPESPLVPWMWGGMLTAATTVGALRIASGKHFPSDVVVGAAVGSLFGYGIPRLHLNPTAKMINKKESKEQENKKEDKKNGTEGPSPKGRMNLNWEFEPGLFFLAGVSVPVPGVVVRF